MSDEGQRRTLVAGGTGQVGEGIVRALLAAGDHVIVPGRDADRLAALRSRLDGPRGLETIEGDVGDQAGARSVRDVVLEGGRLDAVVASVGGWWSGPPAIDVPLRVWDEVLGRGLGTHLTLAQAFVPALADVPGSTYLLINGGGAEEPVAGSSAVNVSAAAQLMLGRVLAVEQADARVRIATLLIETPVLTRDRPEGKPGWVTADDVGTEVARLFAASDDEVRGRTVRVPR